MGKCVCVWGEGEMCRKCVCREVCVHMCEGVYACVCVCGKYVCGGMWDEECVSLEKCVGSMEGVWGCVGSVYAEPQ